LSAKHLAFERTLCKTLKASVKTEAGYDADKNLHLHVRFIYIKGWEKKSPVQNRAFS